MQLHKRAWRIISVAALVTFALPTASLSLATPANAQTAPLPPSSISTAAGGAIAAATPGPVAFNPIGIQHTETFTCGAGLTPSSTNAGFPGTSTSPVGQGSIGFTGPTVNLVPGCYNVTASVSDITQGTSATFTSATCGNQVATVTTATVNCASYASPICPVGQTATPANAGAGFNFCTGNPGPTPTTTAAGVTTYTCPTGFTVSPAFSGNPTTCVAKATSASNTVTVTLNPGAPHAYLITFTGYTPTQDGFPGTTGVAACAPGETYVPGPYNLTISGSAPPNEVVTPVQNGVCQFTVAAQKKYVEITNVNLTGVDSNGNPCTGGPVLFSEGLKSFFGPPCTLSAVALGTLILKSGVNCAQPTTGIGPEPVTGAAAPAEYGKGAQYSCVGDTLSVINIPSSLFFPAGLPLTFTSTGAGLSNTLPAVTLNGLCAGNPGSGSVVGSTAGTVTLCPTGFGAASVNACFTGFTTPGGTINTQPVPVCSASINLTFTAPANQRVVPQVRWAGEKIVLTKCFGGGGLMSGAAVEFTLQGDSRANATLIPTSLPDNTVSGGVGGTGGGTATSASQNTVFTVTDVNGCASVIAYARDEGVVSVDAAIFSTTSGPVGGTPLINEHAFLVYFLKFDHVDLENTTSTTYPVASLVSSLTFTTGAAVPTGFPSQGTLPGPLAATFTLPNPPGTGQVAGTSGIAVPLCAIDYVRAMVHGFFEISGDPSGRPATSVSIPNAPAGAAASYVLPAGRWVLPEDWPVLATLAGANGFSGDPTTNTVFQFDLNSGFVFNPGGERADLCRGPATRPASATNGVIPATKYSTGPCFGQDAAGVPYSTAPSGQCAGGQTIGIGPFDPTQECTNTAPFTNPNPFPLQYAPSGGLLISQGTGTGVNPGAFTLGPLSANSTYLPNGSLTQWDAPMPPAQVSFGITSGPGFLTEVNKTGRYAVTAGTLFNAAGAVVTPGVALYPNPFYAEAIPASPLIPPITNNGGYLYDSFGFHGGSTAGFTTAGAFVPGLSTSVNVPTDFTTACPPGFYLQGPGVCVSSDFVAPIPCAANGGTDVAGVCTIGTANVTAPGQQGGTLAGGTNSSNFGPGCLTAGVGLSTAANSLSVTVLDGTGFTPGMTVSAFSTATGNVLAQNLQLTAVTFANAATTSGAATLTFTGSSVSTGLCIFAYTAVFVSNQIAVPVPSGQGSLFGAGTSIGLAAPGGGNASTTVATSGLSGGGALNIVINGQTYVFLSGAGALAREIGNCLLGIGPVSGPVAFGTCSPSTLFPAGTLLTVGPTTGGNGIAPVRGPVPNPYPFWQWVPNASSTAVRTATTTGPTAATVYSDNHGEAEVSLQTGVASQVVPVSGACPANYTAVPSAAAPTNCLLNFGTLGSAATTPGGIPFATVASALAAYTAATPGCLNTTATGTTSPAAVISPLIGATGPAAGQICINNLGGLDFGPGATFGSTSLQVIADYPYTRGDHAPISSAVLTKNFTSSFAKTLTVSPGTAAPAGTTTYTVTISATDVCGNPLTGENVNVFAIGNAGAVVLAPLGTNGSPLGTNAANVTIDANGNAVLALEVLSTALGNSGLIVKAVFPDEKVERFVTVVPGSTTPTTTTVLYTPGYNMVGGPSGSNFGQAEAVFSYSAATGQYTNSTASDASLSSAAPACQGYYAYFASAAAVNLTVSSKPGDTAQCTLAPGFNLIGNPFGSAAQLPSGTTAYHFNGTTYDVVSLIPVGGAAFVYNSSATSTTITLTAS